MKKLLTIMLLSLAFSGFSQQDTLQAKIGDSADLIIIARKPSAYSELKKLDLNKVVNELVAGVEKSDTRTATMKVFGKNEFEKEKQKRFSKAYLNYFIGLSYTDTYYNSELNFLSQINSYPSIGYQNVINNRSSWGTANYVSRVIASPYLSISVNKDLHLVKKSNIAVDLKMGAEPFFSYEKLEFSKTNLDRRSPTNIYQMADKNSGPNGNYTGGRPQIIDTMITAKFDGQNSLIYYSLYNNGKEVQNFVSYPYDVVKAGLNFRFLPKFSFYDNKGKRRFSLAVGPTVGMNILRKSITKIDSESAVNVPVLVGGTKPGLTRYGLAAELGIGGISFFGQYVVSGSSIRGDVVETAFMGRVESSSPSYVKDYKTYTFNFGLRFGK